MRRLGGGELGKDRTDWRKTRLCEEEGGGACWQVAGMEATEEQKQEQKT